MKDPTRIDKVIASLRAAWEGQPDLPLATLLGVVSNAGIGWGSSDEQLVEVLEELASVHPPLFPIPGAQAGTFPVGAAASAAASTAPTAGNRGASVSFGTWLVETTDQGRGVHTSAVLDAKHIVVHTVPLQRAGGRGPAAREATQPVVWEYGRIRRTGPARPFVVADSDGFEHRMGVVKQISALQPTTLDVEHLNGLHQGHLHGYAYAVRTESATVVVGKRIHVYEKLRRELKRDTLSWSRIRSCTPGDDLVVELSAGGTACLGAVQDIFIAKAPIRRVDGMGA
ncbi:hypothetical protein CPHO_10560 [Corynebacterium phocae]|uniref:Uncharacterized protein n=1 Tax=Corynebacterium phocae TaxID=161895 RepID=A0A1L7D5Q3_9CORY|nr:hypothetical protein [Corynebacterium phocae]APT93262.1 hypothetical protein CPHO_10560 [Corynebacterium phocae]KAA8721583.1 hypothetical protein F4V58_10040 [Corynebacterium phocae]